jgi:hypothetical protein
MVNAQEAGSQPEPADNQASNGEIVPDEDASAASLRHDADANPASDRETLGEHVQHRRAGEPAGVTRDAPATSPPDAVDETAMTTEERAALEAGGKRTNARGDHMEIEGPNSS